MRCGQGGGFHAARRKQKLHARRHILPPLHTLLYIWRHGSRHTAACPCATHGMRRGQGGGFHAARRKQKLHARRRILPPFTVGLAHRCRRRPSTLWGGGLPFAEKWPHKRRLRRAREEQNFLPCGNFPPPVWKFLSSRVEIFLLPCGNFFPPVWKFSSSRVEIFFLPCGNFPPPVWKFSSSRAEIFLLPYGNFYAPKRA